jgi:hypothetical protein
MQKVEYRWNKEKLISFIIAELILFSSVGISYGVYVNSISIPFTFEEPVSFTMDSTPFTLHPNDLFTRDANITNISNRAINVVLTATINPPNSDINITVLDGSNALNPPCIIEVPALSSKTVTIQLSVNASAVIPEPNEFELIVSVSRGG